jgi:uncharacterized protein (DUF488 family)
MKPIYTFGYNGRDPQALRDLLVEMDAVLVDIRFNPVSRQPGWNRYDTKETIGLATLLGNSYCYMSALGNVNYKGGDIELKAPAIGVAMLQILAEEHTVVLMCACREFEKCHRKTVSELLSYIGITTEELAWPAKKKVQQELFS